MRKSVLAAAIAAAALQASAADFALEEIVVTAQKRAQSLQDVPVTVSVVSAEDIQNADMSKVAEIEKMVPSLRIITTGPPARTSIKIRGVGTGSSDPSLEPSVGIFIDGVYMPRSVFGLSDLVDVERIEVLNGPQGTLYGKNTNAGVISVSTKAMPEDFEGSVALTAGSDEQTDIHLSVANKINDELGFRFGAIDRQRDGMLEDMNSGREYNETDKGSYRGQLYWDPSDALSLRAIGYYSKSEGRSGIQEAEYSSDFITGMQLLTGVDLSNQLDYDSKNRVVNRDYAPETETEVAGGSLQLDYALDSGLTLTSITAYQEWEQDGYGQDVDTSPLDVIATSLYNQEDAISQEFRLASAGGETVDWIAGLYYFDSDLTIGDRNSANTQWGQDILPFLNLVGHSFNHEASFGTESLSVFGQATWNMTESTSLTAGLRYAAEEKDFSTYVDAFDDAGVSYGSGGTVGAINARISGVAANGLQPINLKDDLSDEDVTGMISLNHHIGDAMLYASIATGSKSAGFNGSYGSLSLADREYDGETSTNYELGAKFEGLMDGRARVNVAYFYTEFDDFQTTIYDASIPGFVTSNADSQITQGVDLDAMLRATENLTLSMGLQYLDAKFDDFEGAACHPSAPGAVQVSPTAYICDLSGTRVNGAANWTGNAAANYVYPLNDGAELYVSLMMNFKTEHSISTDSNPTQIESYENVDARLGWRNDNWDLALWGKNISDQDVMQASSENTLTGTFFPSFGLTQRESYNYYINDPATYGVTARYTF